MNAFSPYIGIIKAVALVVIVLGLFGAGVKIGAGHVHAKWDQAKADQTEATLQVERETRRAVDAITVNRQKEKQLAKATIDNLRADVRRGAERLSVAVSSCSGGGSGSGYTEARAELLPAAADRIVGIIGEADEAVRDLDECVDKYNAVRQAQRSSP